MTRLKVPEKDVRRAIRGWLDVRRIAHIPVEARKPMRDKQGRVFFVNEQSRDAGIADFVAFWTVTDGGPYRLLGRGSMMPVIPIAIEAKRYPDGQPSAAQLAWRAEWEKLGFPYLLVRSVEDLEKGWPVAVR